jgi:hypothetical protein
MAGIDIYPTQQAIKAALVAEIPWEVVSGGVPTADTITNRRVEGILNPYVVLRFADIMPGARGKSVAGPLYDEYYSYVDALCVGETDDEARELASLVNAKLLGRIFPNTTALARNFGGGLYAVESGNRLPEAFVAVTSFRFNTNVDAVSTTEYL